MLTLSCPVQVRRDNPRLTTRREGGHAPARVVMSRTLDLPEVGRTTMEHAGNRAYQGEE
jgi:riboflavin biosynthesis pyrimidine reductase